MNRLNRRRFLALGAASTASVVLVACGNESPSEETLSPTQIPDVAGAPPTLAPITGTPQAEAGGGSGDGGGESGGGAGTVTILALDSLAFDPSELDVAPGQTLVLQNDGFLQHNLVVDEWGGELTPLLNNAETAEFTIPEDAAVGDSFEYYCNVPGHKEGGMVGTFTIVEAGAETAGAAGEEEAPAEEGTAGAGSGEAVTILALDSLAFDPSELEVSPGQTLTLQNDGFLQHDLAVDDWGGELTPLLNNGETAEFTIPEDAAVGESFEYYCTVPGHKEGGMVGTFTIVEGGGEAAAAPAEEEPAEEDTAAVAGTGGESGGEAVTILALDTLSFDPSELEVSPGQSLTLQNDGFLQHDLAVDDWGGPLTEMLNNGETGEFTIPEDAAVGEQFEYYCSVPGHKEGGMVGTFTIVEGGGEAAAAPAEEAPAEEATAEDEAAGAAEGASGGATTIIALDSFAFEPSELDVAPGQTFTLQNDGFLQHDLAVDDWGGPLTGMLNNGETEEFTIPEDAAVGEQFEFYCSVPGHKEGGMVGTFTVIEGGSETAAAAPAADEAEESTPETAVAADPMDVQVTATEWAFEPADFEVAPGGTITLVNEGTVQHAMTAEAFGGAFIQAGSNQSATFTVPADAEVGETIEYTAVNSNATSLGMGGTITIVEGDGSAAAGTPAAATPMASPAAAEGADDEEGAASGEAITILALDTLSFDPSELEVTPGQTLTLQNDGFLQHDLAVDDWSDEPLTPMLNNGESAEFTIPEDAAVGESFEYYCTVPGHKEGGMVGTFTIV